MVLSSTCSPVVRRSLATATVVAAVPPTTSGAQPDRASESRAIDKRAVTDLKEFAITACLRVTGRRCRRIRHEAKEYELLGCASCGRGEHKDGCRFRAKCY